MARPNKAELSHEQLIDERLTVQDQFHEQYAKSAQSIAKRNPNTRILMPKSYQS
jgi:hypothetical protein